MTKRLSAQAWIDFALATLAREGFEALKADVLAHKLGVSRGSFYWHFKDKLENKLHKLVCANLLDLTRTRRAIASNWERLFTKIYGVAPRG